MMNLLCLDQRTLAYYQSDNYDKYKGWKGSLTAAYSAQLSSISKEEIVTTLIKLEKKLVWQNLNILHV